MFPLLRNIPGKTFNLSVTLGDTFKYIITYFRKEIFGNIVLKYDKNGRLCDSKRNCKNEDIAHTINQTLWPDHCVKNTLDSQLSTQLDYRESDIFIKKGFNCEIDSYSTFYDNGGFEKTELHDRLQEAGVDTLYVSGLALDYCVFWSAMDAARLNYKTYVILDATRSITPEGVATAVQSMVESGIKLVNANDIMNGQVYSLPSTLLILTCMVILKYTNL